MTASGATDRLDQIVKAFEEIADPRKGVLPNLFIDHAVLLDVLPASVVDADAAPAQKAQALYLAIYSVLENAYAAVGAAVGRNSPAQSATANRVMAAGAAIGIINLAPVRANDKPFDFGQPFAQLIGGRSSSVEFRRSTAGLWILDNPQNTPRGFKNHQGACLAALRDALFEYLADDVATAGLVASSRFQMRVYGGSPPPESAVAPPQENVPEEHPKESSHRAPKSRTPVYTGFGLAAVVIAGAIIYWPHSDHGHKAPGDAGAISSIGSTLVTKQPTPSSQPSATLTTSSSQGNPTGTSLRLTVEAVGDSSGSGSFAFLSTPAHVGQSFMAKVDSGTFNMDTIATSKAAISDGAYAVGGVQINAQVSNVSSHEVAIYNVRVIDRKTNPKPQIDAAFEGVTGGAPTDQMAFSLDAPTPVAKKFDITKAGYLGDGRFFDSTQVTIRPGDPSETFAMTFDIQHGATEFDLAVDYVVDGHKYTQIITNGDQPFRALGSDSGCPTPTAVLRKLALDASGANYVIVPDQPRSTGCQ